MLGRSLKSIASLIPLSRRARIVSALLPARHWYGFAVFASSLHRKLGPRVGDSGPLTEALMLDNWLRALTFYGEFPIPWQPGQVEILAQNKPGHGVLYCWTHVPLIEIPLRALLDLGYSLDYVVADPGKIVDGDQFVVPGLRQRVTAISADKRVLTKVRTALNQGKSVACLADTEIFGPLSSQALRVAGMVNAFVIFQWAEQLLDGSIQVTFIPAPHPFCSNDAEIQENLEFLRVMNRKTLTSLGAHLDQNPLPNADAAHPSRHH